MPYLLTPGNQPGSPTSWVKMDPSNDLSSGGPSTTLSNGLENAGTGARSMTPTTASLLPQQTQHQVSSSGGGGVVVGGGKLSGRMTTGRPLPRPLPPIVSSAGGGTATAGPLHTIRNYSNYVTMSERGGGGQSHLSPLQNANSTSQPSGLGVLHINQQGSASNLWSGMADHSAISGGQATLPRIPNPHHQMSGGATPGGGSGLFTNHLNSLAGMSNSGFNTLNTAHIDRTAGTPLSPASVLSNYSLNRNMVNHLNLTNLVPSANGILPNGHQVRTETNLESPSYQTAQGVGSLGGYSDNPTMPRGGLSGSHALPQQPPPQSAIDQLQSERIEVQMMPPHDIDWGDNTTAVTGLSDLAYPPDLMGRWGDDFSGGGSSGGGAGPSAFSDDEGWRFLCHRYVGTWTVTALAILAFVSPLAMIAIPKTQALGLKHNQMVCEVECEGLLMGVAFKLLILGVGSWALFFRQPKATMPRIYLFRACLAVLIFVFIFAFWLFYGVRVIDRGRSRRLQYLDIVHFASSMLDALLFIHYLAILLMELKHASPQFYVKVVRSPDGESRSYAIGQLSVQRAATWILEKYYTDFPVYNPYLERLPPHSPAATNAGLKNRLSNGSNPTANLTPTLNNGKVISNNFKYYEPSELGTIPEKDNRAMSSPSGGFNRKGSSHHHTSDRLYEEYEYERRLKKRKLRLLAATEEAFVHLRKLTEEKLASKGSIDSYELAQSIFPNLARALQKYLRITRQQPRHTMESILAHLATCIKFECSPKAFLEKYWVSGPVLQSDRERKPIQTWALICDLLLSRSIKDGTVFQLRQGNDVSLLCTVHALPHFNLTEEIIDQQSNKFFIKFGGGSGGSGSSRSGSNRSSGSSETPV